MINDGIYAITLFIKQHSHIPTLQFSLGKFARPYLAIIIRHQVEHPAQVLDNIFEIRSQLFESSLKKRDILISKCKIKYFFHFKSFPRGITQYYKMI